MTNIKIKSLYLATALLGATTIYGVNDLYKKYPSLTESYSIQLELGSVKMDLNDKKFNLRDIKKNNQEYIYKQARDLLAKEDSLEKKIDKLENSSIYQEENKSHTIDSIIYSLAGISFIISSVLSGIVFLVSYIEKNKTKKRNL